MYIVGKAKVDKQGRINVNGLFRQDKMPKQVVIAIDVENEMIEVFLNENEAQDFGVVQTIDAKSRLSLPNWLREEIGENKELFLIIDGNKKYISIKTGNVLPKA